MKKKKIKLRKFIVTGGLGFIGMNLVNFLLNKKNCKV